MNTKTRVAKSEKMDKALFNNFKRWVADQPSEEVAGKKIDRSRITIRNLLRSKSGHPETISKVREVLNLQTA